MISTQSHDLLIVFRGRHASKLTEEEEDQECLKEEEGGISGSGGTRLLTQPSCKYLNVALLFIYNAAQVLLQPLNRS